MFHLIQLLLLFVFKIHFSFTCKCCCWGSSLNLVSAYVKLFYTNTFITPLQKHLEVFDIFSLPSPCRFSTTPCRPIASPSYSVILTAWRARFFSFSHRVSSRSRGTSQIKRIMLADIMRRARIFHRRPYVKEFWGVYINYNVCRVRHRPGPTLYHVLTYVMRGDAMRKIVFFFFRPTGEAL